MRQRVNIIGAGIAGLSAGCYLQMNGYETEIFEMHDRPGGLCTSWQRKGYTVDNCIHWLVGTRPGDSFYKLWHELVEMPRMKFVDHAEWLLIEGDDGRQLRIFLDIDRLEAEMLIKCPADATRIRAYTGACRRLTQMELPVDKAPETFGLLDTLKLIGRYIPYVGTLRRWGRVSAAEYAAGCRDPLLKMAFEQMFSPETVMLFLAMTQVWMHQQNAGYPIGGSLNFARRIEQRYLALGGKIHYKSRVNSITVADNITDGVLLENGRNHKADIVISAADGHATIFEMLEGKYTDQKVCDIYANFEPFPSYFLVSFGIARTFENEEHSLVLQLPKPLVIEDGSVHRELFVRVFNFDPTLAPAGKTVVSVTLPSRKYTYWQELRGKDHKAYRAQKERLAQQIFDILESRYGDMKSRLEMTDVSTPATVIRYTNNWQGSLEGWLATPKTGFNSLKKTLPGLKNFYLAGQWVEPGGGLPVAMMSGRNLAQLICKEDKKEFVTSRCESQS